VTCYDNKKRAKKTNFVRRMLRFLKSWLKTTENTGITGSFFAKNNSKKRHNCMFLQLKKSLYFTTEKNDNSYQWEEFTQQTN
jgi:hypothetical protein